MESVAMAVDTAAGCIQVRADRCPATIAHMHKLRRNLIPAGKTQLQVECFRTARLLCLPSAERACRGIYEIDRRMR